MRRPIGAKFCRVISTRPNFILYNTGPKFRKAHPKKFQRPKTCKIWPDFERLKSSAANISGKDEDIQSTFCIAIPPALGERSSVNFDPLITEVVKSYPPKSTFSEYHISSPEGCCAPEFLHTLENDQVLLAHPRGRGPLLHCFSKRGQNQLKIQHIRPYNFDGCGSSTTILCHMTCHKVGMIIYIQIFAPQKFWRAKKSKIRPDFGQLSNLTANTLKINRDIRNQKQT